ncbi:hypothetical protein ACHAXT_008187 [Thalassiosira profunda]
MAIRGHVVSADSVQAYRGVDIGANKPTLKERERTPHHLVDVVDPPTDSRAASYNAAAWMRDAEYVIQKLTLCEGEIGEVGEDCHDGETKMRRKAIDKTLSERLGATENGAILPVIVGGTMMYLQWLVHGRPDAVRPTEEAVARAAVKIEGFRRAADDACGSHETHDVVVGEDDASDVAAWSAASTYVSSLGPVFSQRVAKLPGRDWYRLRRLLEVAYTVASKKAGDESMHNSEEEILRNLTDGEVYTGIRSRSLSDAGYDVRCFFLCPDERMTHFHTVDQRCEQMLLRGLLRETAVLYAGGGLPEESQVTRAIGYRQTLEYLKRNDARRNDAATFMQFVDDFATATRQYAKKQMQWFRRDASFAFVPVQMERDKAERSAEAAGIIRGMCQLSREAFDAELSSSEENGELPLSAQTKLDNERQGKKMKVFMSKRTILVEGSDEFASALREADECTKQVQGLGDEF